MVCWQNSEIEFVILIPADVNKREYFVLINDYFYRQGVCLWDWILEFYIL